jgi:hypothetical protein
MENTIDQVLCANCGKRVINPQPPQNVLRAPNQVILVEPLNKNFPKLYKIELWAKKPAAQFNHKIIKAYLHLEQPGPIFLHNLRDLCVQTGSPYYVQSFDGNYNAMKTDAGNSHGKVFLDNRVTVSIYPRVREEIEKWFPQ